MVLLVAILPAVVFSLSRPQTRGVPYDLPVVALNHQSALRGYPTDLITASIGAGIVGIRYALHKMGLVARVALLALYDILGCRSTRC